MVKSSHPQKNLKQEGGEDLNFDANYSEDD